MPPDPKQTPPAAQADPPPPATEDRISALEAEQKRQGGMLEQILGRLPGKNPGGQTGQSDPAPAPGGKSVAEQVREGIEALEAERASKAEADANRQAREDYARRLAALEERAPAETSATPVGTFRAAVQRIGFGIDTPGR